MQEHSRTRKANSWLIEVVDFSAFSGGIPGGLEGVPVVTATLQKKSLWGQIRQNAGMSLLIYLWLSLPSTPLH